MTDTAAKKAGSGRLLPLLWLGGAVLLWGTSFVGTKEAQTGFDPLFVTWLRMLIATVVFLPFLPRVPRPRYRRGDWKWLVAFALFEPCLYFVFESYAIRLTTASQAGVVTAIAPLLVALGARIFLRERLSARTVAGIVVSLGGVAALSLGGGAQAAAANPALGNALEVGAMVCATGYMLVVKHLVDRYDPWMLVAFQNVVGVLFFLPAAFLSHPATLAGVPARAWVATLLLGLVSIGAFGLYNAAVARMSASRAAMSINLIPLVAMGTGVLFMHDRLWPVQIAGCVAIAAGVALGESGGAESPAPAEADAAVEPAEAEPELA